MKNAKTMKNAKKVTEVVSRQLSRPEEIDDISSEWAQLQARKYSLGVAEAELLARIQTVAGSDKDRGVVTIVGDRFTIKMTRRVNVRYEKDGLNDPLTELAKAVPEMIDYVTLSVSEKGVRLTNVFDKDPLDRNTFERMIVSKLGEFRVSTQGKPGIAIITHGDE